MRHSAHRSPGTGDWIFLITPDAVCARFLLPRPRAGRHPIGRTGRQTDDQKAIVFKPIETHCSISRAVSSTNRCWNAGLTAKTPLDRADFLQFMNSLFFRIYLQNHSGTQQSLPKCHTGKFSKRCRSDKTLIKTLLTSQTTKKFFKLSINQFRINE